MIGSFKVKVTRRRRVSFDFTVRRNITVLCGDSGTGKTTLFGMIADHALEGDKSGVTVQCDQPCVALTDIDWKNQLENTSDSIVFIDEGRRFIFSEDFAACVKNSSNYYVIITREAMPNIPYSIDEMYEIKTSGKRHTFVPKYPNRGGHRYSLSRALPKADFDVLLTEDSNSGFQFFDARLGASGVQCVSSMGCGNVAKWLEEHKGEHVFVVADGAAFGSQAERAMLSQDEYRDFITLCLPESFEWLILSSGLVKSDELKSLLQDPSAYIESGEYVSWEKFFTKYLTSITNKTAFAYSKGEIADAYKLPQNADKVMALVACRNIK